jgi:hypothetical protein
LDGRALILGQWNAVFCALPIESLIKAQQDRYYRVLGEADQAASSTVFIGFMLEIIETVLIEFGLQIGIHLPHTLNQGFDNV